MERLHGLVNPTFKHQRHDFERARIGGFDGIVVGNRRFMQNVVNHLVAITGMTDANA